MDWFSPDYATARARFLDAVRAVGGELTALELEARGPHGEKLAIDVAWLGAERPRRAFVHLSGVHGVEGFAGSAIQLAWLAGRMPTPAPDAAVILVHVVNPYGMAWLRRVNENNVDLNRNVLGERGSYAGAPELYGEIEAFLNPRTPPSRDFFYLKAALLVARYGLRRPMAAIAAGQYEFPKGLFYGGSELEEGPRRLRAFLTERLEAAETLTVVDVHTGLGPWGRDTLIEHTTEERPDSRPGVAYRVQGALGTLFSQAAPLARGRYVLQEFGTLHAVRVLHALREENRWAQHGDGTLEHSVKRRLREAFAPRDPKWRSAVVRRGIEVIESALTPPLPG